VRFLVDDQLPPALARQLVASGHQAEHLVDVGLKGAADREVWRHAAITGAVIVTKDEDFVVLLEPGGPAVVAQDGDTRRHVLLMRVAAALPKVVAKLEQGELRVELGQVTWRSDSTDAWRDPEQISAVPQEPTGLSRPPR
jgi:predicted nuclease of predicted toxin-antitoxin system